MWILALETSGPSGSIALCNDTQCNDTQSNDTQCVEERTLELAGRHGQTLIPEIHRLLTDHRLTPAECSALAVSVGPGSFTGLRVGVVCAKTFAYATRGKVAAVDTLAAVACNAPLDFESQPVDVVHVISDAQRTDVFAAAYHRVQGEWECRSPVEILSASEWAQRRSPTDVVSGPGLEKYRELVSGKCRVLPEVSWRPRALWVGHLGRKDLLNGVETDVWSLQPRYFRRSSAEDKWDARKV